MKKQKDVVAKQSKATLEAGVAEPEFSVQNQRITFDLDLSALEHAHMCMYEACLHAQLPLTEALRLLVQHVLQPLPPVTPADEVRSRLDGKMRAHFSEVRFANDM